MPQSGCGTYLLKLLPPSTYPRDFFPHYILNSSVESDLKVIANQDSNRYFYNALASFLSAVGGLHSNQAVWAITKLYYTVFYIGRAFLCHNNHIIFHAPSHPKIGNTQYELAIHAGNSPTVSKKHHSTHKLVAKRFCEMGYPSFMSGLVVDNQDPIMWLMEQREYWQYRASRFPDPDMPKILAQINTFKIQRLFQDYSQDQSGVYISDPDHAILSVPFRLISWGLSNGSWNLASIADDGELEYLKKRCQIGKQILTVIKNSLG